MTKTLELSKRLIESIKNEPERWTVDDTQITNGLIIRDDGWRIILVSVHNLYSLFSQPVRVQLRYEGAINIPITSLRKELVTTVLDFIKDDNERRVKEMP